MCMMLVIYSNILSGFVFAPSNPKIMIDYRPKVAHNNNIASYPGPSGGERAWYTLQVHVPGENWGNRVLSYTLRLSSIELHVM